MNLTKKLTFVPVYLIFLSYLTYSISQLLGKTNLVFGIDIATIQTLLIIILTLTLTSLFFIIFATLAQNWGLILLTSALALVIPIIFLTLKLGIIFSVFILLGTLLNFALLNSKLKTYLTFQPTSLLSPSVKLFASFLIIGISVIYFFSIQEGISKNGFQIPDSLIDTALKFSPQTQDLGQISTPNLENLNISKEQIEMLKKNPALLDQYGIDPSLLDSFDDQDKQASTPTSPVKQLIKAKFDQLVKPYTPFIAPILGLLFFVSLNSIMYLFSFFISPLIWFIFKILTKTGFINFTTEMREVKKMVV